jgi:hypothetical protein
MNHVPLLALLAALLAGPAQARLADARNRMVAECMGDKYHVSAALLVSIRLHENPRPSADYKCCGVKDPSGKHRWYPGGIWAQYAKCAWIVARHAKRHGWDGRRPTRAQVVHLGRAYAEGSTSWGASVWAIRRQVLREAAR